jgi:formylglycine-generating enzyme required for sulfatase activity
VILTVPKDGEVTFWYRVSSERGYDVLRFSVDGRVLGEWSGEVAWTQVSYPVTAGTRTFRWEYAKDGSVSSGADTAYLDDIVFPGVAPPQAPTPAVPAGMVLIPAGRFQMGDSFGEGDSDERPVHTVTVSAFYMDVHEVTKALWDKVATWAAANGYDLKPGDGYGKAPNHPVCNVTWYEAVKWCNARSEREGLTPAYYTSSAKTTVYRTGKLDIQADWVRWDAGYRLPTEAEWERAARGGCEGRRFPWCDADTITHSRANYESSSAYSYDTSPTRGGHPTYETGGYPYTSPVGSFAPNGYGLYDMAGNVREWCWDWYSSDYYSSSPGTDPRGPGSGSYRVLRGGSWYFNASYCRVADRDFDWPDFDGSYLGFRAVLPPGP